MDSIEKIREAINKIDYEILKLLAERNRLSLEVIKSKNMMHKPVIDLLREEEVLKRVVSISKEIDLDEKYIERIYKYILENSIELQRDFLFKNK
ncbi:MAG: hypothetical protein A2V66_03800 [Ignavibacteria bacterium RBG_13_36_8]|nr:MAG: hypothetical protein A2V66_03800 [Ignavibacteria bacterium RBG_13_36_8]